jgi:hypothetical protein
MAGFSLSLPRSDTSILLPLDDVLLPPVGGLLGYYKLRPMVTEWPLRLLQD